MTKKEFQQRAVLAVLPQFIYTGKPEGVALDELETKLKEVWETAGDLYDKMP